MTDEIYCQFLLGGKIIDFWLTPQPPRLGDQVRLNGFPPQEVSKVIWSKNPTLNVDIHLKSVNYTDRELEELQA